MPAQALARSNRPVVTIKLRKVNGAPFHSSDHEYGAVACDLETGENAPSVYRTSSTDRAFWKSRWSEGRPIPAKNGADAG